MDSKNCPRCKQILPLNQFSNSRHRKDGKTVYCKKCNHIALVKWRNENKDYCREYYREYTSRYYHEHGIHKPYNEAKDCTIYLGDIAERLLINVFKDVKRMPFHHPFDFLCNNGYKIDVKSSIAHIHKETKSKTRFWKFSSKKNKIADCFACVAFDDRTNLNPLHFWLIPCDIARNKYTIEIFESRLSKWQQYERPIDKVISCCKSMKL